MRAKAEDFFIVTISRDIQLLISEMALTNNMFFQEYNSISTLFPNCLF